MQGNKAHDTLRYRCTVSQTRALRAYLSDHPKAVYVREDAVVRVLDAWLPTLVDADLLAASQEPDASTSTRHAELTRRVSEIDQATRNLVSAIEAGTDPAVIQPRLAELKVEREAAARDLTGMTAPAALTSGDIERILDELGGLGQVLGTAEPNEKAQIYASLGLRLSLPTGREPGGGDGRPGPCP
jgi:site-specific DNA recombinase